MLREKFAFPQRGCVYDYEKRGSRSRAARSSAPARGWEGGELPPPTDPRSFTPGRTKFRFVVRLETVSTREKWQAAFMAGTRGWRMGDWSCDNWSLFARRMGWHLDNCFMGTTWCSRFLIGRGIIARVKHGSGTCLGLFDLESLTEGRGVSYFGFLGQVSREGKYCIVYRGGG